MKNDHSFPDIGDLLRSRKPETPVPPGLEQRILRTLDQRARPQPKRRVWPWLLLPPAFAAVILLLLSQKPDRTATPPPRAAQAIAVPVPDSTPILSLARAGNPLDAETSALARDVKRAGGFLIDCMPSIGSPAESR